MMKSLLSLLRSSRGAAAIELALFAPLAAAMVIGLVDISTAHSTKLRLEQVSQRLIEKVQSTGFNTSDEAALEAEATAAATAAGLTGASSNVTYWLECDGVKENSFTGTCADGASVARYMQLDIQQTFSPMILAKFSSSNDNGTITVHGLAGIRVQ